MGLENATWSQWFSNEIAKRCAVSDKTVEGIAAGEIVTARRLAAPTLSAST